MNEILAAITRKKKQLDSLKPLPVALEKKLYIWTRNELTYSSNALEGNTLTSGETAIILEKGITIGGKTLVEHLEAVGHARAVDFIKKLAGHTTHKTLTVEHLLVIHEHIVGASDAVSAWMLGRVARSDTHGPASLGNNLKIPELLEQFVASINASTEHPALLAARAHLQLGFIPPFVDANGSTARLLMNLLLLQAGYPMTIIDNSMRNAYIESIENALLHEKPEPFYDFIYHAIDKSLDNYLDAISNSASRSH